MSRAVRFTWEGAEQARVSDEWWREHREAAPGLFADELARGCRLLARAPDVGQRYASPSLPGVRRLFLARSRFHIYYLALPGEIVVVAVWSAVRGHGPAL